jgi:branched-chain amino acid transport system permease protein
VRELLRALERGLDFAGTTIQIPPGTQEIVLALALLSILVFRPQGIVGDYELGVSPPR